MLKLTGLRKDWSGNYRFYVRGTSDKLKDFTIDLAWYHSALAQIWSTNDMNNGDVVLNLVVNVDSYKSEELAEKNIRRLCDKHDVIGFATWDEYRENEKESA